MWSLIFESFDLFLSKVFKLMKMGIYNNWLDFIGNLIGGLFEILYVKNKIL